MSNDAFYLVDDLKLKIEKLLDPIELNSLDSQSREILKLVYKHVDSFEELAKTTIETDLQRAISLELRKLRGIVAQIGSVQFSGGEEDDEVENEEEEYEDEDEDDEEDDNGDEVENEEEEYEDDGEEEDDDGDKEVKFQLAIHDVENLKQRFASFNRRLKMEEQRCSDGLYTSFIDEVEEEDGGNPHDAVTSKMIGADDMYKKLKRNILCPNIFSLRVVTALVGMPGIGKTALANKVFYDPMIVERFNHRVWIQVGKKCRVKDIPRRILAEIHPDKLLGEDDEETVHEYLKASLKSKSYLIVLDDVWDKYIAYLLNPFFRYKRNKRDHPFLHPESGSRILLTSRLQQLYHKHISFARYGHVHIIATRLLNKEESCDLLCEKVFFSKGLSCPPQLVKAGKKISEKCEGLPLTILTVARLLSQDEMSSPECWNEVAAKRTHRLFMDAYDEMSKVLLPSYTYLPPLLKMCFLYIGLFPQNYEIPRSKLINLWRVDRFLELNVNINSYHEAIKLLEELVLDSVVMVYKTSTYNLFHTLWSPFFLVASV